MNKSYLLAAGAFLLVVGLLIYFGRIEKDRLPERITVEALDIAIDQANATGSAWVLVTGRSMEPMIPSKGDGMVGGLAVLDDTPYADLGVGDVVVYNRPESMVIHMIASKHGNRYMLRGIGNQRVDTYYLTEYMFIGRVGRIYVW